MAIKGKNRARSGGSRRVIAAPPRPQLVVRKKQVWQRRGVWIGAGALVVAVILVLALNSVRTHHRAAERQTIADSVSTYSLLLTGKFPPDATTLPPTGYNIYPQLAADIASLEAGTLSGDTLKTKGSSLTTSASTSGDAIDKLDVTKIIPAKADVFEVGDVRGPGATRLALGDGQFLIVQAFHVYAQIGGLFSSAVGLDAAGRKAIAAQAQALSQEAQSLFNRGWQEVINIKTAFGLNTQQPFNPPPPASPPVSPTPSVSPSVSPAPSASATPSGKKHSPKPMPSTSPTA